MRFRYLGDRLFLVCCTLYGLNRWFVKPRVHWAFLQFWFNDLLLIACALPLVLWLFKRLHLRTNDDPPSLLELVWILIVWSLLFEWIGPKFIPWTIADWRDVVMYWTGGICAWLFWRRSSAPGLIDEL